MCILVSVIKKIKTERVLEELYKLYRKKPKANQNSEPKGVCFVFLFSPILFLHGGVLKRISQIQMNEKTIT